MVHVVDLPPDGPMQEDGSVLGGWWHDGSDGRIVCDLCPRECHLKPGDRGFCFVRQNRAGQMVLTTYGRSTGFCIDPIEKKPLNHFYPGTSVLSFGTAGCNLACKFCQNWEISKSREVERLSEQATPEMIATAAQTFGCQSVAFTYNDPIIWAEYAMDTAMACHERGVKTVAVTAGYITKQARGPFFQHLDAANVDLKAFTDEFYQKFTLSALQPILDTLIYLRKETNVWFEITNLVIPQANDERDELRRMCDWIVEHLGTDIPVHFTAFHPDFRMQDRGHTPLQTLLDAYEIAKAAGIDFPYVGNVDEVRHQSTYCPACGHLLIERNWYDLGAYHLNGNRCDNCNHTIAGHFGELPGDWGRRRLPVQMNQFAPRESFVAVDQISNETVVRRGGAAAAQETTDDSAPNPPPGPSKPNTISQPKEHHETMRAEERTAFQKNQDTPGPEFTAEQEAAILKAASQVVKASVEGSRLEIDDPTLSGVAELPVYGGFVSIKRQGNLRGCCGFLGRTTPLLQAIIESGDTSAVGDVRMPRIAVDELPFLEFEVWLLDGLQPVREKGTDRIGAVEIGRHGLQVQAGEARGLLLPGVATDHGYDAEGFLRQVCLKAGISPTAWKDDATQLFTFEGKLVAGSFDVAVLSEDNTSSLPVEPHDCQSLAQLCRNNLVAVARGAVPTYYLPGAADGSVHGLFLRCRVAGVESSLEVSRLSLRNAIPLQSSLFQMAETLGNRLKASGIHSEALQTVDVELAIFDAPAMHGTVARPDLRGCHPARRAILVTHQRKTAWRFDPDSQPEQVVVQLAAAGQMTLPEHTPVYSMTAQCSASPMQHVQVPHPQAGAAVRPPAVAGMFYPAEPHQLTATLNELSPQEPVERERWRAAMVPHAGLIYSGRIAADVLRRIKIPETVVILGPKHTPLGVDLAVAPNQVWQLPGMNLRSNTELAKRLVDGIDNLEFDAAAHQREHAIEVELPWLARMAPHASVVGVAIGVGDFSMCRRFGHQLAAVLKDSLDDVLLVISTDMNHFANDAETRRVDALAIDALKQLDAQQLYDVVRAHEISMCGVLPACIVLTCLAELGQLSECREVAYATSADVSGDKSRVVGYSGMLFR